MAKRKTQYYLIHVWGCVDPKLYGPYATPMKRDKQARFLRQQDTKEQNILFGMNLRAGKSPEIITYSNAFFE